MGRITGNIYVLSIVKGLYKCWQLYNTQKILPEQCFVNVIQSAGAVKIQTRLVIMTKSKVDWLKKIKNMEKGEGGSNKKKKPSECKKN